MGSGWPGIRCAGGAGGGVELVISWIWEVSAQAVGMGFAYGLRDFAKCSNRVFQICIVFAKFVFRFEKKPGIKRNPECTKPAFRLWFTRVAHPPGWPIPPGGPSPWGMGPFWGVFFLILTGGRNMVSFCGSSGPVYAYGLPYPAFWLIDVFFTSAGRLK